jgi:hypothetical protein
MTGDRGQGLENLVNASELAKRGNLRFSLQNALLFEIDDDPS